MIGILMTTVLADTWKIRSLQRDITPLGIFSSR